MLEGKTAIITGGASPYGIGMATASLFARLGCRVAVLDREAMPRSFFDEALAAKHLALVCHVTDPVACRTACEAVVATFGWVDILVNNAGIADSSPLMEITVERYDRMMDVSLRGSLNMSQAIVPHMQARRTGSIVCMSSVAAQRGGGKVGGPHYAAAKAGVLGLMRDMARELARDGIRVNAVAPGLIRTGMTDAFLQEGIEALFAKEVPLGRIGKPVDVAGCCAFLASELSSYLTGVTIDVNGGLHIH